MGISIPLVILMNNNYIYSGTLDSRPSEIGTQYNIPLNRLRCIKARLNT